MRHILQVTTLLHLKQVHTDTAVHRTSHCATSQTPGTEKNPNLKTEDLRGQGYCMGIDEYGAMVEWWNGENRRNSEIKLLHCDTVQSESHTKSL